MHYLKRMTGKKGEDAVSPVVGVMLMLVVTLIIAAVVSAFAGGLVSGTKKAPSLTMDVTITNSGAFASSQFNAKVLSVSEGIPTRNLKLITSWTNTSGFKGGANVTATSNVFGWSGAGFPLTGTAPWGFGPGIASPNSGKPGNLQQQFGNYTLLEGTIMNAYPAGQSGGYIGTTPASSGYGINGNAYNYTSWTYTPGSYVDGMQAVLGQGWEGLRTGDTVNFKIIYIPTGVTIFSKDVVVS